MEAQEAGASVNIDRPPVRVLRDTAPISSSVTVDDKRNEVFLQDSAKTATATAPRITLLPRLPDSLCRPDRIVNGLRAAQQSLEAEVHVLLDVAVEQG